MGISLRGASAARPPRWGHRRVVSLRDGAPSRASEVQVGLSSGASLSIAPSQGSTKRHAVASLHASDRVIECRLTPALEGGEFSTAAEGFDAISKGERAKWREKSKRSEAIVNTHATLQCLLFKPCSRKSWRHHDVPCHQRGERWNDLSWIANMLATAKATSSTACAAPFRALKEESICHSPFPDRSFKRLLSHGRIRPVRLSDRQMYNSTGLVIAVKLRTQ